MPKKNRENVSDILRTQKVNKPKIEDVIPVYLDGDMRKIALDFAAYMRENKMQPVWCLSNAWKAVYKGKCICYIRMPSGPYDNQFDQPRMPEGDRSRNFWVVTPYLNHISEYEWVIMEEGLHDLISENLYRCNSCHPDRDDCALHRKDTRTILGNEVNGLCWGRPAYWFWNPGEAEINCIKRLLELEKKARTE